jgi:hypothetical protein
MELSSSQCLMMKIFFKGKFHRFDQTKFLKFESVMKWNVHDFCVGGAAFLVILLRSLTRPKRFVDATVV